jgi:AcrR family transcriptional regulator
MSSGSKIETERRIPQRPRGERRVAELLDAAASVMAEVGYEASTMTEIAKRAGSSIGAVYQYFPDKPAIAVALRAKYGAEMTEHWIEFADGAASMDIPQMVARLVQLVIEFITGRPAYLTLLGVTTNYRRDATARNRLRKHFASLFQSKAAFLSNEEAYRIANVALQILKGMNTLYAEASAAEREELEAEFTTALTSYLQRRLSAKDV